jgi:lipopolysaccharide/colanic/teichoic acid biosynthesis glycosyltransferase
MFKDFVQLKIRRSLGFTFSLFMITLLSPVLLIIAIAIRLEDGGSVFETHEKAGINGHRFRAYRFRTISENPKVETISLSGKNGQSGCVFKIRIDPEVTRIGSILRKTSMDNLPNFFNVIREESQSQVKVILNPFPSLKMKSLFTIINSN